MASTALGMAFLGAYRLFFESTFVWFGGAMMIGYISGLIVFFVQNMKQLSNGKK